MDAEKQESRRRKIYTWGFIALILFAFLYLLVNFSTLSVFLSGIVNVWQPIIIGAGIAYMLNPLLKLFEFKVFKKIKKNSIKRAFSIVATYLVAILFVVLLLWLMIPQLIESIIDLISKFDDYMVSTTAVINNLIAKVATEEMQIDKQAITTAIANFFSTSGSILETVFSYVGEYAVGLFVGVKNVFLGLFISIYMLLSKERLYAQFKKGCAAFLGARTSHTFRKYLRLTNRTIGNFFLGVLIDSFIIFLITLVSLLIFRIPYALLVSTIVGITNIIPIFGPFIGAIPSAFIIFIANPSKALIFIILVIIIQQLDGNIIAPKIHGNSTGMSSLAVIIAITIMGEYFGILGMIVGVPIFAVIIIIIKQFVESRLRAKSLPIGTEEYYASDSLVDPLEQHETIAVKLFSSIATFGKKIKSVLKKDSKKQLESTNINSKKEEDNNGNTKQ